MNLGQIIAGRDDRQAMRIGAAASALFRGMNAAPGEAESFIRRIQERDPGGRSDQAVARMVAAQVIRSLLLPICRQEDWLVRGALLDMEAALGTGDRDRIACEGAACAAISGKLWSHCENPTPRDRLAFRALSIAAQAREPGLTEFMESVGRFVIAAARIQRPVTGDEAGRLQHRAYKRAAGIYLEVLQHQQARNDRSATTETPAVGDAVEAPYAR
ncbi:MAG: hypothetical protein KJS79_03590 [Rhodospirillales bacterium]|nr:hypothetical protein [Rhodospirillales bacterium]